MPSATVSFNHRPINVDVISSGTYTVPADTYARIVCQVEAGGDIAINGETALRSRGVDPVSQVNTVSSGQSASYAVPVGHYAEINTIVSNPSSVTYTHTIGGVTVQTQSATSGGGNWIVGGGDTLSVSNSGPQQITVTMYGYAVPLDSGMAVAEFWVDAGDEVVLSGTGRITYMEYQA